MIEALQQNTSLSSLVMRDLKTEHVAFIRALPQTTGLRKLSLALNNYDDDIKGVFQGLVQSLETNTTLETLSLKSIGSSNPTAKP
jgi:hypothetical protein